MKSSLLLLALVVAAMSSCTTAYKTGQTPDDVYYSPTRPQDEYVRIEKEDDRRYRYEEDFQEDRYLRMKIRNRNQWSDLNDWYAYERFGFDTTIITDLTITRIMPGTIITIPIAPIRFL